MKNCTECGNELSSEMKFCTKCGTPTTSTEQDSMVSNKKVDNLRESYEPVSRENRSQRRDQPKAKKGKISKWLIAAGAAVILVIAGIAGVMALNDGDGKKAKLATSEPKEEENVKPPSISREEVDTLFPDWQVIKQEILNIDGTYYNVIAIAQNKVEFEESVKIAVVSYDKNAEDNKWTTIWESEEYAADPIVNIEDYIRDFYILNPKDTSVALVAFNLMHAGTARTYDTYAVQIDEDGKGDVAWSGYGSYMEKKEDYIEVMVLGAVRLAVEKDKVKITEIPRSEVGSNDALKVEFTVNSDGLVVPALDEEIYVKKGQPITFVPEDSKAKSLFDKGNISIYYNSMEHAPIATANVNLVYAGNEFTFTDEGSYGFLLDHYIEGSWNESTPPYTFIVHVGDGKKPAESEKAENKPAGDLTEIQAPFPLGTKLSELKAHYGEPSYDDYYNGGRLVVFDKEGYVIDDSNETVSGYYFAAPTLSVFGATVGMTGEEINAVYSERVEPALDETGTEEYLHYYNKNGFKIIFYSQEKEGPTTAVMVVRQ